MLNGITRIDCFLGGNPVLFFGILIGLNISSLEVTEENLSFDTAKTSGRLKGFRNRLQFDRKRKNYYGIQGHHVLTKVGIGIQYRGIFTENW